MPHYFVIFADYLVYSLRKLNFVLMRAIPQEKKKKFNIFSKLSCIFLKKKKRNSTYLANYLKKKKEIQHIILSFLQIILHIP